VGRLLKQLGLSCQRPLFRAIEQDPIRVRRWLEEEYLGAIRERARLAGAEIYFGDEAGVRSDGHAADNVGRQGQDPSSAMHRPAQLYEYDIGGERTRRHALYAD